MAWSRRLTPRRQDRRRYTTACADLAAGCDSELGSSLHWTRLREIADGVVAEAYAAAEISPEAR